jgi:hypothetical protein
MADAINLAICFGVDLDLDDPRAVHLEWPLNDWLADNQPEMNFKAAVLSWPRSTREPQQDTIIFGVRIALQVERQLRIISWKHVDDLKIKT